MVQLEKSWELIFFIHVKDLKRVACYISKETSIMGETVNFKRLRKSLHKPLIPTQSSTWTFTYELLKLNSLDDIIMPLACDK